MGLVDFLKKGLRIGAYGVKFGVVLDHKEWCVGEVITGRVEVEAEQTSVLLTEVSAFVLESWEVSSPESDYWKHRMGTPLILARQVTLTPGVMQSFAFEMPGTYVNIESDWHMVGCVGVHNAGQAEERRPFLLLPPAPLEGVAMALEHASTQCGVTWKTKNRRNSRGQDRLRASFDFYPPASLRSRLDGVTLHTELRGSQVVGTLDIQPHCSAVSRTMRHFIKYESVTHPFSFDAAALSIWRSKPDGPIPADITAQFQAWLAPHLTSC